MDKMKNVIVWYSHNTSASYLSDESLPNDSTRMAPNLCSTDVFNEKSGNFLNRRETFQTSDGIQYWHFKQKQPKYGSNWEEGAQDQEDIRYWIEKLDEKLKAEGKGETIDAIVAPVCMGLKESATANNFVKELKERYPNIKTIIHNASLIFLPKDDNDKTRRFGWPNTDSATLPSALDKATITRDSDGNIEASNGESYGLADGVDVITANQSSDRGQQNALRDALGMEHLPQKARLR